MICYVEHKEKFFSFFFFKVYYFKQGHEMYVKEVMNLELYEINPKKQCFSKLDLKAEELCKVVSLHYVIGPPTLVSLKLCEYYVFIW